jgi:hypothetical protein
MQVEAETIVTAWGLGRIFLSVLLFMAPFCFLSYLLGRACERDAQKARASK